MKSLALQPAQDHLHELRLQLLHILLHVQRNLVLHHYLGDIPCDALAGFEGLHEVEVVRDRIFRLLVENQAGTQRDDVVGINVCEDILEDNLRHQDFVAARDFTGHPALQLYNAILVNELQPPKNSPHGSKVVVHDHEAALVDLLVQLLHLAVEPDLRREAVVVLLQLVMLVEVVRHKLGLQILDAGQHAVHLLGLDVHLSYRLEFRDAKLEGLVVLDLVQGLQQGPP
mmetsp:Transcript_58719/g.137462  ORF Transcript_58719/g.137462 Transcript_58719/m.137462 type:complete len:228 (+) Transcript_58719:233-916(+)